MPILATLMVDFVPATSPVSAHATGILRHIVAVSPSFRQTAIQGPLFTAACNKIDARSTQRVEPSQREEAALLLRAMFDSEDATLTALEHGILEVVLPLAESSISDDRKLAAAILQPMSQWQITRDEIQRLRLPSGSSYSNRS